MYPGLVRNISTRVAVHHAGPSTIPRAGAPSRRIEHDSEVLRLGAVLITDSDMPLAVTPLSFDSKLRQGPWDPDSDRVGAVPTRQSDAKMEFLYTIGDGPCLESFGYGIALAKVPVLVIE